MKNHSATAPPRNAFTDDSHLVTSKGDKLPRYGSTRRACQILDDCDRSVIYDLWKSGAISAYKLNPDRPNSHLHIDLLSVWNHKQRQLAGS